MQKVNCGKVEVFCDPRIENSDIQNKLGVIDSLNRSYSRIELNE